MSEPTAMTYVGMRVPHHILRRAYRRYRGKPVDHEKDDCLWGLADDWVQRTQAKDELSCDELKETTFSLLDILKAIDDIHGREIAGDVYQYVTDIEDDMDKKCEWVLDELDDNGFHLTSYHDWVMDAVTTIEEDKNFINEDDIDEHFGVADITLYGSEDGAVNICITLWSEATILKDNFGTKFVSSDLSDMNRIVQANKPKLDAVMDKLGITEKELPRSIEIFTGVRFDDAT